MPLKAAQLMVTIGADTAAAEQGIMGIARLLGPGGVLGLGAAGAAVAIAGIGIASLKMAGDFQTSLTQIVTGAGESQSNLKLIGDGVLQLSRDTGTSTKQLTDGLYMIESAGYHGAAGLDILKAAAEGAKVGNADLGVTADAVTTIMTDYRKSGINASEATNTLIATVASGKTHMADLAGALSSILPTAQAAGIGLNDVMAAMAAQTAAGVPAADAATHLRQMLIALQAPSSAAKKAMESIGLTTQQVADAMHHSLPGALRLITEHLKKRFPEGSAAYMEALKNISGGSREMQGMLALTGDHLQTFATDAKNLAGPVKKGGDAITGWSLVQGTFNQQMSELGETVKSVMIALGTDLLPVATQLAEFLKNSLGPVVDALTGKHKALASGLGGDLMQAAKQVAGFFKSDVQPIMKQLGDLWTTTIVPILHTFAQVLLKNVLPAIMPIADTIAKKWLPPLIRIYKDILPVLNPLLQAFGWIFQNIIGPALGQVAGLIGATLGKVADLADAIARFIQKPEVQSFIKLIGHAISSGPMAAVGNAFSHLPHFAAGGVMEQSGLALVGEQGPELVQMPGGAQITPMARITGGAALAPLGGGLGGAGAPIHITVHTTLKADGRVLAQVVTPHLHTVIRNATGQRGI